jgi:hypothetical protein
VKYIAFVVGNTYIHTTYATTIRGSSDVGLKKNKQEFMKGKMEEFALKL